MTKSPIHSTREAISRRKFLGAAAASIALPYFIPARVLGANAPSKQISVGFIGTGDHGTNWNLKRYYLENPNARIIWRTSRFNSDAN